MIADVTGWWRAIYHGARGVEGSISRGDHVEVVEPMTKADTRLTRFNAHPEPVRLGRHVRADGKLRIWDDDHWAAYDHQKVALYFKPAGSHKWQYVETTWTSASGYYHFSVRDWRSGWWRAIYAGNDESKGSVSHRDYVRVIR
ncbi:MAG TPA: hypothetical protein VIR33_11560 [Thermopolyspora sp.]